MWVDVITTIVEHSKRALLEKFINDECSKQEIEILLQYLQEGEDDMYHPLMQEVWQKLETYPTVSHQEKDAQFKSLQRRIAVYEETKTKVVPLNLMRIAATLTGILLLSVLINIFLFRGAVVQHKTGFAETKEIRLPDGSLVSLNSNSQITHASDWSEDKDREVFLEGEAFFEVTHTKNNQRFLVETSSSVSVEVLGTRFNVNNRHEKTEVVLRSGKVKLNINDSEHIDMNPGERLSYSEKTREVKKVAVDPEIYTAWKNKQLIFNESSLAEIASVLEDNYGYQVRFQDPGLKQLQFTGTVPTDKLEVLLSMLSKAFGIKIEEKDKILIFQSKQ